MPLNEIYLGEKDGFLILLPAEGRTYQEGESQLSRTERTASGRLVRDVISTKKTFNLNYSLIDDTELIKILEIYELEGEVTLQIKRMDGVVNTHTVLMEPFDRERVLATGNGLWRNVSISMREV